MLATTVGQAARFGDVDAMKKLVHEGTVYRDAATWLFETETKKLFADPRICAHLFMSLAEVIFWYSIKVKVLFSVLYQKTKSKSTSAVKLVKTY